MQTNNAVTFDALYPSPVMRGARIGRLGEKYLGPVATDAETCRSLGEDQIGWFVGGVQTFDRMVENAAKINGSNAGGRWIIVPATKCLAEVAYDQWFGDDAASASDSVDKCAVTMWHDQNVTFCVPERLNELADAIIEQSVAVAGIILLDPNCIVHRGRGFGKGKQRVAHDRPQCLVNFRSKIGIDNWCPPLIVMSRHKAAAISTDAITRVYGLEAMHFIEGSSLRCGATLHNVDKKAPEISGRAANTLVT